MDKDRVIYGIYNADGTFFGELGYVVSKAVGKRSCSLCDISHGWNPFGKSEWKRVCKSSPLDIQLIHRNEATESQLDAAGGLPSFITEVQGGWVQLMTTEQITELKNNVDKLILELEDSAENL